MCILKKCYARRCSLDPSSYIRILLLRYWNFSKFIFKFQTRWNFSNPRMWKFMFVKFAKPSYPSILSIQIVGSLMRCPSGLVGSGSHASADLLIRGRSRSGRSAARGPIVPATTRSRAKIHAADYAQNDEQKQQAERHGYCSVGCLEFLNICRLLSI